MKIKLIAPFFLIMFFLVSCQENKNDYYAAIILPDGKLKTEFPRMVMHYANWQYGYNLNPDSMFKYVALIDKKLSGAAAGAMGTLSITTDTIKYIPQAIYKYIFDGVQSISIPISDVKSAEVFNEDSAFLNKNRLRINTRYGPFIFIETKKVLTDFHLSKSYHQEICDKINALTAKN